MNSEKIEYRRLDGGPVDQKEIDASVNLLHEYLNEFISRDILDRDVEYCFKKGRVLGAYHEGKLVGVVVGVYTPFFDKFHIGHIAVEEGFQGIDIGSELTKKVLPEDVGATVHLNMGNPDVERFYKKLGFEQTHKRFRKVEKREKDVKPSD